MADKETVKHDYRLPDVQALRKKIRECVMQTYGHQTCEGGHFEVLVDLFRECLPPTVNKGTLFDSLRYLAGMKLTPEVIDTVSWRLAGNLPRLKTQSVPIGPWNRQAYKEWVPAQISEAKHQRDERGRVGWTVWFKIVAGTSCPMTIEQHWSKKFCAHAAKCMGFSLRRPSIRSNQFISGKYLHPSEIVSMRLLLLIDPDLCDSEPGFKEISVTPSLLRWNKTQLKFRDRISKKYRCPEGYPASTLCYRCPVGYDRCRAATHPRTYEFEFCSKCEDGNVPFDKVQSDDMCIFCLERQAMERR